MNKLFVSHRTLFPWTLNWCWEWFFFSCWITFQWPFAALWLPWKAVTVYPRSQPLYPPLKATAEQSEHYTLSSAAPVYGFIHFCSTSFPSFLVFQWDIVEVTDRLEMSLNILWFGNGDYCKWHWANGIFFSFLILANTTKCAYWTQKSVSNNLIIPLTMLNMRCGGWLYPGCHRMT